MKKEKIEGVENLVRKYAEMDKTLTKLAELSKHMLMICKEAGLIIHRGKSQKEVILVANNKYGMHSMLPVS